VEYPAWLLKEEAAALRFLENSVPDDSRVLASYEMGNWVPPYVGVRCVLGHYALTMDSEAKKRDIQRFYSAGEDADGWRLEMLRRWKVTFLLDTRWERALGGFDPSRRAWLREIFKAGEDPARMSRVYALLNPSPAEGPSIHAPRP